MISVVTGKIGSGKSLLVISKMLDHFEKGGLVLTNLALFPDAIRSEMKRRKTFFDDSQYRFLDLNEDVDFCCSLSRGTDELNVFVAIDEAHLFYNSAEHRTLDSKIKNLVSFLTQSRKFNIDIWFITQHPDTLYGQFKKQAQDLYYCVDLRRVVFPLFGSLASMGLQWIRKDFQSKTVQEKGKTPLSSHIFDCYDTKQTFDTHATDLKQSLPVFNPITKETCSDLEYSSRSSSPFLELVGFYSMTRFLASLKKDRFERSLLSPYRRLQRIRRSLKNPKWPIILK